MTGLHSSTVLLVFICVATSLEGTLAFRPGDYVPLARRAQFSQHRTQWHDVQGEHCPRFDRDASTLVPLPQPGLGYQPGGSYKVQLSINAEQLVTPWLPVLGLAVPPLVYVDVQLARTGGEIAALRATVRTMPPDSPHARDAAAALWQNATHWPKPLRVYYTWQAGPEVREERALLFLLGAAVVALALVARNAHRAYRSQLAAFVARVARPPEPKAD